VPKKNQQQIILKKITEKNGLPGGITKLQLINRQQLHEIGRNKKGRPDQAPFLAFYC
jgi:hypothetical protein